MGQKYYIVWQTTNADFPAVYNLILTAFDAAERVMTKEVVPGALSGAEEVVNM